MLQTIPDKTKDQPESAKLTLDWANEPEVITVMLLPHITFNFTVYLESLYFYSVLVDHSRKPF